MPESDPTPVSLLEVRDLRVGPGERGPVDGVSLRVETGEIVALIGERGSGKRAVFDAIVGEAEKSGTVLFRNKDISSVSARDIRKQNLVSTLHRRSRWERVCDALWEPTIRARLRRSLSRSGNFPGSNNLDASIAAAMSAVGMPYDCIDLTLRQLSYGQILRIHLAELWISRPALIVLDEPFKVWDNFTRLQGQAILKDWKDSSGISILLSDRSWNALRICDRAYVLDAGRIVDSGAAEHVLRQWFGVGGALGPIVPRLRAAFLSYRRKDTTDVVGRIRDQLNAHFGDGAVWQDSNDISAGASFREVIDFALDQCDMLLAVIGQEWLGINAGQQTPRIEDREDLVRAEIETALERRIPVIPVLVHGAELPSREKLPESLHPILDRQALTLRPDPEFRKDINRLILEIERMQQSREVTERLFPSEERGRRAATASKSESK